MPSLNRESPGFPRTKSATSAYDPFNLDADPDPGSAKEKNGSGSKLFL